MVVDEGVDSNGGETELEVEEGEGEGVVEAGAGTETARRSTTADIHLQPQTFMDQTRSPGTTLT